MAFHELSQPWVSSLLGIVTHSLAFLDTLSIPVTVPDPKPREFFEEMCWVFCGGRDESERRRAESQWIVAARPLCHLQYPVAYLSRLQRILPAARWEWYFKAARAARPPRGLANDTCLWEPEGPYCWSANGRRAHASLLARILT